MINWEKAPEGTTHFYQKGGGQWWIKRIDDLYHWWPVGKASKWRGAEYRFGGAEFHNLDKNTLYVFGTQVPIGLAYFEGENPFEIVPDQPKPQRKVGWW